MTTLASVDGTAGSLAVDARNVYFLRNNQGSSDADVMSVPIAGGAVVTLAAAPFARALAIDATSAYWVTSPQHGTPDGTVMRLPLAGGTPQTLASGQVDPSGVAVGGGDVYWADRNGRTSMGYGGQVLAEPVGGGASPMVFGDQAEGELAMNSSAVFWQAEYVHWTASAFDDDELIETEPLAGGTQVTLADAPRGSTWFGPLVADDSNLFYYAALVNASPIGIVKVPLAGGAPTTITSGVGDPVFGIALDDTSLYWINGDGTVMRQTPK